MKKFIKAIHLILLITSTFMFWGSLEGMSAENIGRFIFNFWDRMRGQPVTTRSGLAVPLPLLRFQEEKLAESNGSQLSLTDKRQQHERNNQNYSISTNFSGNIFRYTEF